MEYIRLTDEEFRTDDSVPYISYFEVDPQNERIGKRQIEVYSSGRIVCVTEEEYLRTVIELVPVPTVEELNQGIWSERQHAECIAKEQLEALWTEHAQ